MKKLEEMLREKTIKNKLSFVFRIMDVLYVVLALVAVVGLIQSKNYVGSVIVVIIVVLAIAFNATMSKMLAKMLVEPIESLVVASEKIASGDFEIGTPYESEDELGRLSDSFETAAGILKKVVSDLQDIVEHFAEGNFDVHSNCPDAYVGQLRNVLDELDDMVNKVSETMHGIQGSSEQVSAGVVAGISGLIIFELLNAILGRCITIPQLSGGIVRKIDILILVALIVGGVAAGYLYLIFKKLASIIFGFFSKEFLRLAKKEYLIRLTGEVTLYPCSLSFFTK